MDAKPHKTAESGMGFDVILQQASPGVKLVLKIMAANPGAYIERKSILNFARLIVPGQNPLRIQQGYVLSLIEYCKEKEWLGGHTYKHELHPDALQFIARMEQTN